ncbi:MAG TPA: class I SAM-dependent methyltransferase [Acetobacteraceae bacterium]|nr:class I SAM-dependent methyltransferase [Acetobacteraceae bacterium]
MNESTIDRRFGRQAFGASPGGYHAARPAYPDWVFQTLCEQCGLARGRAVFEIGAGTGKATRRLLDLGADPLVALEPDPRLAAFLRKTARDAALRVIVSSFEDAALNTPSFDLGVCATAFHWLDENAALLKVADLLRPGGWWAAFWNVFGDDSRPDPFHEATKALLAGPSSPSAGSCNLPFALDASARLGALRQTGRFDIVEHRTAAWSLELDPEQTVALYATFSNINIRSDQQIILTELNRIAREKFLGRVLRNMTTSLYIARRRS